MALKFIDSCGDFYNTSEITRKWNTNSNFSVASSGRNGNRLTSSAAGSYVSKTLAAQGTWYVGFALKLDSLPTSTALVLGIIDSSTFQGSLAVESDGSLSVWKRSALAVNRIQLGASAGHSLLTGIWYHIELKYTVSATVGSFELRVNGVTWASGTGLDTKGGNDTTARTFRFYSGVHTASFDDIYILDTTGTRDETKSFLGDVKVDTRFPTADGLVEWTPDTGATHYTRVNGAAQDDDTSYVATSLTGQSETFKFGTISASGDIFGVAVNVLARKDGEDQRFIAPAARRTSAVSPVQGTSAELTTSYLVYSSIFETQPGTTDAWSTTALNLAEFGVVSVE